MSNPSEFVIIRQKSDKIEKLTDKEFMEARAYSGLVTNCFSNKEYTEDELPKYFAVNRLQYVDKDTKEVFDEVMQVEFNSEFSCLKDEYNISAYGNHNLHEISYAEASQMLEAINYLLLEHYDKKMESDVYQNSFIDIFASHYTPHYNFIVGDRKDEEGNAFKIDLSDAEYNDERAMLKKVKIILDTFITMYDEGKYRFIDSTLDYKLLYIAC